MENHLWGWGKAASYTWAWPGLLSIERERERQLYGGGGSRRAYWKQRAHQINRNIEMKWLTTFYDCICELPNRVEFSGQSRVLKLQCEFSWGDVIKCLFVPGGAWVTEQRRSGTCSCVVNQWIYWACFWEHVWHKESNGCRSPPNHEGWLVEAVSLQLTSQLTTYRQQCGPQYPIPSNCLMIIYIKVKLHESCVRSTLDFESIIYFQRLSSLPFFSKWHVSIKRK